MFDFRLTDSDVPSALARAEPLAGIMDLELCCKDCQCIFIFTVGEQEFYAEKGFEGPPQRCRDCRQAKKTRFEGGGGGGAAAGSGYGSYSLYSAYGVGFADRPRGICYDFLEGRCNRGDTCKFTHDDSCCSHRHAPPAAAATGYSAPYSGSSAAAAAAAAAMNGIVMPRGVCYAFLEGRCHRGETCKFAHDDGSGSGIGGGGGASSFSGGGAGFGGGALGGGLVGGYGEFSAYGGSPLSSSYGLPRGVCYDFQAGRCMRGDACRFAHTL